MLLAMALYVTLMLRDVLRPLLAQLGARHRLPVDEIRAPITLRTKLVFFFSSVTVFTSGLVLLFALSPSHALWIMLASIALALGLALGLVLLIVRDMVNPVRALEERSDEMARGELARPVPPSGEADEIGRLTLRLRGDAARAARQAAVDRIAERRSRTRGPPPHRGARAAQRRAARRAREAEARAGRPGPLREAGVDGPARRRHRPRDQQPGQRRHQHPRRRSKRRSRRWPPSATAMPAARGAGEAQEMLRVVQRGAARTKAIVQALHNYSRGDEQRPRELDDRPQRRRHAGSAAPPAAQRPRREADRSRPAHARLPRPDRSGVHEPDHQRGAGAGRARQRRHDPDRRCAARATTSRSPSPTTAPASRPTSSRASSIRSSRPRTSARGRGWGCRSSTASSSATAAASRSQSQVGEGTTFRIVLPVRSAPPPTPVYPRDNLARGMSPEWRRCHSGMRMALMANSVVVSSYMNSMTCAIPEQMASQLKSGRAWS